MALFEDPALLANALDSRVSTKFGPLHVWKGVPAHPESQSARGRGSATYVIAAGDFRQELIDPNLDVVRSLTVEKLPAYETALYGLRSQPLEPERPLGAAPIGTTRSSKKKQSLPCSLLMLC